MEPQVILVDEQDNAIGQAGKMEAHRTPSLHRAFSIFVFDKSGRLLIHKRAGSKYHSGGLWTNTCCSHPAPGETLLAAAKTRLQFEMGFETPLVPIGTFIYRIAFPSGLNEYELDHVLCGIWEGYPSFNPEEVEETQWVHIKDLKLQLQHNSELFTAWFPKAFQMVLESSFFMNHSWEGRAN